MSLSGRVVRADHRATRARRRAFMNRGEFELALSVRGKAETPGSYFRRADMSRIRWLLRNGRIRSRHEAEDWLAMLPRGEAEALARRNGVDLKLCLAGRHVVCACVYPLGATARWCAGCRSDET